MDEEIVLTVLAAALGFIIFFATVRLSNRRKGSWDRRNGEIRGNGGRRGSDRGAAPAVQSAVLRAPQPDLSRKAA